MATNKLPKHRKTSKSNSIPTQEQAKNAKGQKRAVSALFDVASPVMSIMELGNTFVSGAEIVTTDALRDAVSGIVDAVINAMDEVGILEGRGGAFENSEGAKHAMQADCILTNLSVLLETLANASDGGQPDGATECAIGMAVVAMGREAGREIDRAIKALDPSETVMGFDDPDFRLHGRG